MRPRHWICCAKTGGSELIQQGILQFKTKNEQLAIQSIWVLLITGVGMETYLLPENDGLSARPSGAWAKDKLFYLQKYISTFETSMRNRPWRRRIYIDLFSGPGKCVVDGTNEYFLGSPLLAITTEHPFTDYYFVDMDGKNIEALKKRIAKAGISRERTKFWAGNANTTVVELVKEIQQIDKNFIPGAWPSLNLAFLDPEGLELEWNTVAELGKINRMDLIIHYSQQGIKRMADRAVESSKETIVDKFFGDTDWRKIYLAHKNDAIGIHRHLMDYYKSKLKTLGYVEVKDDEEIWAEPLMKNSKNAPLYRLLFASKHPLGLKFWKDITKIGPDGQIPLWKI
jgi:three-Cys-motif partner protein